MIKIERLHRTIFCAYWIYFYALRGPLGNLRALDYASIALLIIGLLLLVAREGMSASVAKWVTIIVSPLAIAAVIDPSIYIFMFVAKTYLVALYLALYVKMMRITTTELTCFVIPFIISVYYFLNPSEYQSTYLTQGRMAGIDEPNFTSLSLVLSMCSAYGLRLLTRNRLLKGVATAIIACCVVGVVLTASRAGIIGAAIGLGVFAIMGLKKSYTSIAVVAVIVAAIVFSDYASRQLAFVRFQPLVNQQNVFAAVVDQRPYMEQAWRTVWQGPWFIGGGPQMVTAWGSLNFSVPHNSLLDIGVGFGKACFLTYCTLVVYLLAVNIYTLAKNLYLTASTDILASIISVIFLALLPMYMFLSAGMAMSFVFWLAFGGCALLRDPHAAATDLLGTST